VLLKRAKKRELKTKRKITETIKKARSELAGSPR
jgi:hypothetical protein